MISVHASPLHLVAHGHSMPTIWTITFLVLN